MSEKSQRSVFKCPFPYCARTYGTTIARNLHIKQFHSGGNKIERRNLSVSLSPLTLTRLDRVYLSQAPRIETASDEISITPQFPRSKLLSSCFLIVYCHQEYFQKIIKKSKLTAKEHGKLFGLMCNIPSLMEEMEKSYENNMFNP